MTKAGLDSVTFGEAMVMFVAEETGDLSSVEHFFRRLAGAETNVAIGLARLGLKSGWASKVGNDVFGAYVKQRLKSESVNIDCVKTDLKYPTGFQLKSKVLSGDPEVQYFRKGSAASTMGSQDFDPEYFTSSRHLHMTGIPLALSPHTRDFAKQAVSVMRKAGRTISFDPNLRPSLWPSCEEMIHVTNSFAFEADWVLPGLEEARILTGLTDVRAIADYYLDRGVKLVVVKLGPEGAYYRTASEEGTVPGFPVAHVVDTVGAGDGFAVGTISGMLLGLPVDQAVLRGNAIGSLAVQTAGDHDGYPNAADLETYIQAGVVQLH